MTISKQMTSLSLALILSYLMGCGFDHSQPTPSQVQQPGVVPPTAVAITAGTGAFTPESVTITAGGTVEWTNLDGDVIHQIVADDGSFQSGTMIGDTSYSNTFTSEGTFTYHCGIHPTVTGTVVVNALPE